MVDKKVCNLLIFIVEHTEELFGKKISVSEFARIIDVPRSAIAEVQGYRREPSKKVIKRILELYGVNLLDKTYLSLVHNDEFGEFFPEKEQPHRLLAMLQRVIVAHRLGNALEHYTAATEGTLSTSDIDDSTRLHLEIKKLKSDKESLQYENNDLKKERLLLLDEVERLKELNSKCNTAVNENHFTKIENDDLKEEIKNLKSELISLRADYEWLKKNSTINPDAIGKFNPDDNPF